MGRFVIVAVALAGCFDPKLPTGAPCTNGTCPSGLECAAATNTCEKPGTTPPTDASVDPPTDALACGATQIACNDECVDPMTDVRYCGDCMTACTGTDSCLAGACTNPTASCAAIKSNDPTAQDGVYTSQGAMVFCDMASGTTYEEVGFGQFNVAPPPGYAIMRATDLQTTVGQQAFIALYNLQGGAKTIATFTSSNCCVTTAPGLRLRFDAASIQPAGKCNQVGGYVDAVYPLTNFALPLATTHFDGHTIGENAGCSENNNPALFFKTRM